MSMRRLINLVESAQAVDEKYTADNSALLRYMKNDDFDPYHAWYWICQWLEENDYLDDMARALRRDHLTADDLHEEDPELFYKLPEDVQKSCAEDVLAQMMQNDPANAPSHQHMMLSQDKLLPRTTWLLHFTNDPDGIGYNGFKYGIDEMDRLGLTTYFHDSAKQHGGYNFAFHAGSRYARNAEREEQYGRHAVLFQHSGVEVYHHADEETQVIFRGPEVDWRTIVILKRRDDGWNVVPKMRLKSGRNFLFKGDFEDCVNWVQKNFSQYRRAMTGA